MSDHDVPDDLTTFVRENRQTLVDIIKHGTDQFVRALALAALVEYGDDPDLEQVRHELRQAVDQEGSE